MYVFAWETESRINKNVHLPGASWINEWADTDSIQTDHFFVCVCVHCSKHGRKMEKGKLSQQSFFLHLFLSIFLSHLNLLKQQDGRLDDVVQERESSERQLCGQICLLWGLRSKENGQIVWKMIERQQWFKKKTLVTTKKCRKPSTTAQLNSRLATQQKVILGATHVNRKLRLRFAQANQNWTREDWKNVAWSGNSMLLLIWLFTYFVSVRTYSCILRRISGSGDYRKIVFD